VEQIMHRAKLGHCFGILTLFFVSAGPAAFAQNAIQPAKDSLAATQKLDPGSLLPAKMSLSVAPESKSTMKMQEMGSGTTIEHLEGARANMQASSDKTTGRSFMGQLKVSAH
jgi:hypothetical protein